IPIVGAVTLDMVFAAIMDVKNTQSIHSSRLDLLEAKVREINNDTVGVRHESRDLVAFARETEKKMEAIYEVVEQLKERVPPPPIGPRYGIFGLTEADVAAIDDRDESTLRFAGKLDKLLFDTSPLPHQERDKERMKWLIEVVLYRRRNEVGNERRKWKTDILQRINANATREEDRRPRYTPYTPPTLISSTRITPSSIARTPTTH
ncbi:hypothetical protein PENTCL1PPCAC_20893, partial [Pristionchus entomophagus]